MCIGMKSVRSVPCDDQCKMDVAVLEDMIKACKTQAINLHYDIYIYLFNIQ